MNHIPLKTAHHRPGDGLTLNSGSVALRFFRGSGPVLLRKPIFVTVQEGPDPLSPPGSAHGLIRNFHTGRELSGRIVKYKY